MPPSSLYIYLSPSLPLRVTYLRYYIHTCTPHISKDRCLFGTTVLTTNEESYFIKNVHKANLNTGGSLNVGFTTMHSAEMLSGGFNWIFFGFVIDLILEWKPTLMDHITDEVVLNGASSEALSCRQVRSSDVLGDHLTAHERLDQHGAQRCHFHVCLGMSKGRICARHTHTHSAACTIYTHTQCKHAFL